MKTAEEMLIDRIKELQKEKKQLKDELESTKEELLDALVKLERYE